MSSTVTMTGPIFSPNVETMTKETIKAIESDLVKAGIKDVREQLYPGHGKLTGDFRRSITGSKRHLNSSIYPKLWVIGLWLEGVGSRNATTSFKGYGIFAKASEELRGDSDDIAEKRVKALVGKLN